MKTARQLLDELNASRQQGQAPSARDLLNQIEGRRGQASGAPTAMDLMRATVPVAQAQGTGRGPQASVADPVQGDPTLMTTIADNVVGLDNGVMSPGEKAGTFLNNAGEALTGGIVGDEAAAAFDEAIGVGSYDERLEHYRANQEQFKGENPVLSFASEVAPLLVPGMAGGKLVGILTEKLGRVGAGAALGALSSAIYGFSEGEGGARERLESGAKLGAAGLLFGGSLAAATSAFKGAPRAVRKLFDESQRRPTIEAQRATKNAAYHAVEQAGETFSGDDMKGLYGRVSQAFNEGNYVEEVDDASRAVLRILDRRQGQDTTLSQLDGIRQNLWQRYSRAGDQPQILDAIFEIDQLIATRADASDLMTAARAANSRYAKSLLLEDAFQKARDQTASTGSGGNILNKYRQAVTRIINDPKQSRFFAQEEVDLMREFVEGSGGENFLRQVGKLSPNGNGLMMALHVFGGIQTGGLSLGAAAAGAGAKSLADRSAMRGAENILNVVAGVPAQAARTAAPIGAPTRGAITAGPATLEELRANGLLRTPNYRQ